MVTELNSIVIFIGKVVNLLIKFKSSRYLGIKNTYNGFIEKIQNYAYKSLWACKVWFNLKKLILLTFNIS